MEGFERIRGQCTAVEQLRRITKMLREPKKYLDAGVHLPHGVLIAGQPGSGLSTMAQAFLEESGCEEVPAEEGLSHFDSFRKALETATPEKPMIFKVDGLNTIDPQGAYEIGNCMEEDEKHCILFLGVAELGMESPDYAFLRDVRFDVVVELHAPEADEVRETIEALLAGKPVGEDFDMAQAADLLAGYNVGTMETVLNQALLRALTDGTGELTTQDVFCAFAETLCPRVHPETDRSRKTENSILSAWHEAGHAVVGEVLSQGSVTLIDSGESGGATFYRPEPVLTRNLCNEFQHVSSMGGRAATELVFGEADFGARTDLEAAFRYARRSVVTYCSDGLDCGNAEDEGAPSELMKQRRESAVIRVVERSHETAREILRKNRPFLEAVANALAEKGMLTGKELRAIRDRFTLTQVKRAA